MKNIELLLFGKKLSDGENSFIGAFPTISTGWMLSIWGPVFEIRKGIGELVIFALVYFCFSMLICIITGRIIASKKERISGFRVFVVILITAIQTMGLIYLYSYRILESKSSLWITIPACLIITTTSVAWMCRQRIHLFNFK